MRLRTPLVLDSLVAAALIATGMTTLGCLIGEPGVAELFFPTMPMEWESALSLFLLYCAYWGYQHHRPTVARATSLLALTIGVICFVAHLLESQPSFLQDIHSSGSVFFQDATMTISPQLSVAIIFSACAILLLLRWTNALSLIWAGILCIAVVVLGLSVLLGHLFHFRVAVRWSDAAAISPLSAIFVVLMGSLVARSVWTEKRHLEESASEAWRQFVLVAVAGVVLTTLVSAIFSVLPLYDRLDTMRNHGLERELENRANRFRRWVSELETLGAEMASRPSWEVLRAQYEQRVSRDEYFALVEDKTADIKRLHPEILGMRRISPTQETIYSWGSIAPLGTLPNEALSGERLVLSPIEINERLVFPLITPIRDQHSAILGWDILYFSARGLASIFRPLKEFHEELQPLLLVNDETLKAYSYAQDSLELRRSSLTHGFLDLVRAADADEFTLETAVQANSEDPLIRLVARTDVRPVSLGYIIPSAVLHREEDEKLLTFFLSVVLLALFGSSGVYFIIHHLLNETAALQFQVDEKNRLLSEASVERERIAGELTASRHQAALIFENSPVGIALFTTDGAIVSANPAFFALFGVKEDDLRAITLDRLVPEIRGLIPSFSELTESRRGELRATRHSGEEFKAELQCIPVRMPLFHGLAIFVDDIQERALAEAALRQSLREKELLLKEIHHRVKNNLQMISSLLSLQSRGITDDSLRRAFEDSQSRIRSIALLHDLLYKSKDLAQVNFAAYLESLCSRLLMSLGANDTVRCELSISSGLELPVDLALPCGLIVNELLTNAVKYAVGSKKTEVDVSFAEMRGEYTLSVKDNGPGLPSSFNIETSQSLGLKLVRSLVRQLGGAIECTTQNGTCWTITFIISGSAVSSGHESRMANHG